MDALCVFVIETDAGDVIVAVQQAWGLRGRDIKPFALHW